MEDGSAIRSGTAADPGGAPVSRPGPTSCASVRSWPLRSGAASCLPSTPEPSAKVPSGTTAGGTLTVLTSLPARFAPAGRSRAAARTLTVWAGAGVSWWTAIPAAAQRRSATARRRLRFSHPAKRRPRGRGRAAEPGNALPRPGRTAGRDALAGKIPVAGMPPRYGLSVGSRQVQAAVCGKGAPRRIGRLPCKREPTLGARGVPD
jgi:hypothetical protein